MYQEFNGIYGDNGSSSLGSSSNDKMMQASERQMMNLSKEISDLKESASNLFTVPEALENLQDTVSVMQDNLDSLRKDVKKILSILSSKSPLDKSLSVSRNSSDVMDEQLNRQTEGHDPGNSAIPFNRQTQQRRISNMPFNKETQASSSSETTFNRGVETVDSQVARRSKRRLDVPGRENSNQPVNQNAYETTSTSSKHFQSKFKHNEMVPHLEMEDTRGTGSLEDRMSSKNDHSMDTNSTLSGDVEDESMVDVEDISLLRYKRKLTDPKNDNRLIFFYEGAEIQMNADDHQKQPARVQEQTQAAKPMEHFRQSARDETFPRQAPKSFEHLRQPTSLQTAKAQDDQARYQDRSEPINKQTQLKQQQPTTDSGFTQVAQVKPVVKQNETLDPEETDLKAKALPNKTSTIQTEKQSLEVEPVLQSNLVAVTPLSSIDAEQGQGGPDLTSLDDAIPRLEEMTLKEATKAADCTDPKSQGADTIICVDTSESMAGVPIQQAKNFITEFLDGIEEAAVEYGLEENIAIVTFGHENTIVQHLTNDYGKIRDVVDSLETGGPSPMMTGLVLCLSAIFNRGGVVTYRERKIQPRILLISDGKATDERVLQGPDVINPPSSKERVQGKLTEFAERIKTEPRIVYCIPVGEAADESIMKVVSETTSGCIISLDKATYTSRYFLLNTITAKITTSGLFDDPDSNPEKNELERMIREQLKEIADPFLISEVFKMVNESIVQSRAESAKTASRNQIEADLLKNIPPVGARVRRGKDWKYDSVDDNGPGTVTGHKGKGWVTVQWDSNNKGKYRYGAEAAMDVRPVDEPRSLSDGDLAAVGVRVRRGPDWEWGNQDGGESSTGVIFKMEDSGIVHVRWDNGKRGNYRFGLFGKFDVEICMGPDSQTPNQNEELLGATASPPARQMRPQWQWKDNETDQWHDHVQSDSDRIEALHKKGKGTILVTCNGESFRVVPQSLHQRNVSKGITNEIRRKEIPV